MENNKKKKWPIVLLIILAAVIMYGVPIVLSFVITLQDNIEIEEKNNQTIIDKGNIIIDNVSSFYDEQGDTYYVSGLLKNVSDNDYNNIILTYLLYDEQRNILGEATAYLNGIKSNDNWKFKASYTCYDASLVTSFKLTKVDLY